MFVDVLWWWREDYVHANGQLLGSEREAAEGGRRHYHLDHLGTTRTVTNAQGQQLARNDFFPFGTEASSIRQEIVRGYEEENLFKFTGHERDYAGGTATENVNQLDYMHARYYSPVLGRFLVIDPVIAKRAPRQPQAWNRYSYVLNNPVRLVDPTGRLFQLSGCGNRESSDCSNQMSLVTSAFGKQAAEASKYLQLDKNGTLSLKGITAQGFGAKFGDVGKGLARIIDNKSATFTLTTSSTGSAGYAAGSPVGGTMNVDTGAFPRMLGGVSVSATEAFVHELAHAVSSLIPGHADAINAAAGTSLLTKASPRNEAYATVFENAWRRETMGLTSIRTGYSQEGDVRDLGDVELFP